MLDLDVLLQSHSSKYVIMFSECSVNTFGQNCSRTCGHCLGAERCNHIDGTCETGCAAGWQGRLCLTGKTLFWLTAWDGLRYFIVALLSIPYNYFIIFVYSKIERDFPMWLITGWKSLCTKMHIITRTRPTL